MKKIAVIPGDGIGIEVCKVGVEVLEALKLPVQADNFDYGAEKYLKTGITLPESEVENFRNNYDAIFLGALGDPRVPTNEHAKDILLGLRFKLDLYVNFRPARLFDESLCPLKNKTKEHIKFVVFRENTEGIYVSAGGSFKKGTQDEIALQESINTRKGVERIIRYAFEYAEKNGLTKICMSDKGNAMRFEGDLWMRTFKEVAKEFPKISPSHQYVDALVMNLIRVPEDFEVIVTCNLFGDIVT
ncbi:3-isopropylmalate dehydrogenase, partial [bacterium]|nr:3-isopropylmalate dehydrogenase [bacterium]